MTNGQIGTFAYPGGKTLIRQWLIDHFPSHTGYIEAFGGSGSVLANKQRSELEVYNDVNSDCVKFFKAVKHNGDELKEWIDATPYSKELFEEYVESYPDWPEDTVEHAGRFLFVQTAMFGGKVIGESSATFQRTKPDNSRLDACNSKILRRKPEDIESLKERFKGVVIEQMDFEELIDKYDREGAFFYFDPPYVDVGDGYYQTESGGFDHERFVDCVSSMDSQWLISYDENIPERLSDYYTVDRTKTASMSTSLPEKTESLIMNYDPNDTPMFRETEQQGLENYE